MGRIDGSVGQRDYAYEFYIIWEETDINVANNTSKIIATSYIYCKQHSAYNNNTYNHTITIDGETFTTRVAGVSLSPGVVKQLASASKIITHDDDGSKWINISANSPTLPSGNGYGPANGSASEDVGLYTIPRASSVMCADGNIGSSTVININRASSSFKHTLEYSFNGLTGTIATKTDNTSIGWNIPTSFYAKIPNALSGSGTITCKTYNGDTLIGTSTCTFNAFVVNSNPTVTATVVDTNSKTIALTGDSNKIVKYYSNAKVDITATAKNSASITERKVIAGNRNGTGTSVTLNGVETNVFNVSCKDSRGLTASTKITKTLVNYIKLAITNIVLERPEQTSNTVNISLNGNYFNNTFGAVANTLELKFRYKQDGGTFGNYTTLTVTKSGNTFSYSGALGTDFDYQKQYVFEVVASDKLMTVPYTRTVTKGIPQVDRGKNDIKYNTDIQINGNFKACNETYIKFKCNLENMTEILNNTNSCNNYLRNSENEVNMYVPSNSYNQYTFDSTHPMSLITSSNTRFYTLSFRYKPTNWDANYVPATNIVVGGTTDTDSWQIRLEFNGGWRISHYPDYNLYESSFSIPGDNKSYLQSFVKFIIESSSENVGGTVSHVKLEDGLVSTNWTPNIEDILDRINGYELYNNSSGTTGTVVLSENVSNFKFLEIYYQSDNQYRSIKIANPNGKVVMLSNWLYEDSSTWFYVRINKITISGTSITKNLERSCALGSSSTIENEWSKMAITKVVGYK